MPRHCPPRCPQPEFATGHRPRGVRVKVGGNPLRDEFVHPVSGRRECWCGIGLLAVNKVSDEEINRGPVLTVESNASRVVQLRHAIHQDRCKFDVGDAPG